MPVPSWCEWLQGSAVGTMVRESLWGFPILVTIHLMAIGLSAGLLFWFDLRPVGVTLRRWPILAFYRRLAPWMLTGFAIMFVTGGLLFTGYATSVYPNIFFRVKMSAMVLGGINALVFHFVTEQRLAGWESGATPGSAKFAGLASILVWTTVILAGRMMAYTIF